VVAGSLVGDAKTDANWASRSSMMSDEEAVNAVDELAPAGFAVHMM
jgi:hypothetical protein